MGRSSEGAETVPVKKGCALCPISRHVHVVCEDPILVLALRTSKLFLKTFCATSVECRISSEFLVEKLYLISHATSRAKTFTVLGLLFLTNRTKLVFARAQMFLCFLLFYFREGF